MSNRIVKVRLRIAIGLILLLTTGSAAQLDSLPTIDVVRPEYTYSQTVESLRAIDFDNFVFRIFNRDGKPDLVALLRRAVYDNGVKDLRKGIHDSVELEWTKFVGADSQFAVIGLWYLTVGGSSSSSGIVQVFAVRDKHPVVIQQFRYNTRGCQKAGATFNAATGVLRITGVHGWEHCCPTTLDIVSYQWTGSEFNRRSANSVPLEPNC